MTQADPAAIAVTRVPHRPGTATGPGTLTASPNERSE